MEEKRGAPCRRPNGRKGPELYNKRPAVGTATRMSNTAQTERQTLRVATWNLSPVIRKRAVSRLGVEQRKVRKQNAKFSFKKLS